MFSAGRSSPGSCYTTPSARYTTYIHSFTDCNSNVFIFLYSSDGHSTSGLFNSFWMGASWWKWSKMRGQRKMPKIDEHHINSYRYCKTLQRHRSALGVGIGMNLTIRYVSRYLGHDTIHITILRFKEFMYFRLYWSEDKLSQNHFIHNSYFLFQWMKH